MTASDPPVPATACPRASRPNQAPNQAGAVPCKICGETSPVFGVVDFHKSCEEARGKQLASSGVPIAYRRCPRCGFVFTNAFDPWDIEDFRRSIYNADYRLVDPDCVEARPVGNARLVAETFAASRQSIRILDYGGGSGLLAERLRAEGFAAQTYDPFSQWNRLPGETFDLITAFEVMEHLPDPRATAASMVSLLRQPGAILFSTLVQPEDFLQQGLRWWYAAPRNGHVSLHTRSSLAGLFRPLGWHVVSFNAALHLAYRTVPPFARHLVSPIQEPIPAADGRQDR